MFNLVNRTDSLNKEYFTESNIEWACFILDSRLVYVDYEAYLIPMLDFAYPGQSDINPSRVLKLKFEENGDSTVRSMSDFSKDQEVFENYGYTSDSNLLHKGFILENNFHDCYSMILSFNDKTQDDLKQFRISVFSRYFLFDSSTNNEIM